MNKQPPSAVVHKDKPAPRSRVNAPSLSPTPFTSPFKPLLAGMEHGLRPQDVLQLQRTIGNRAVQRVLDSQDAGTSKPAQEPSSKEDVQTDESAEEQVELDLDGDEETELHTLSLDPETGQLMIHSDPETLEDFLKKYQLKLKTPQDQKILSDIKKIADIVHTGRYGTKYIDSKGYTKTKAPTVGQRSYVKPQLTLIAQKLQTLTTTKYRPPSHKETHNLKNVDGELFCEKIVMQPLSLLPRDDGVEGSPPSQETKLWRSLTNFAGYKRGHMLNEHLHGPGTNDNLVPISTAFNATMREGVEKEAKKAVNSQNKVVRLEVEALDWGLFPGAFGFPEEKKLPNKFHFKLQQMKKKAVGGNGSQSADWEVTGPVLHDTTPNHDIPTDVVKGVVAPTVKTFVPGLYFYPYGSISYANPNFHMKGSFSINNLMNYEVLAGLGIDEAKNLKYSSIDETVLTEYKLPPGYGIKKLPPTEIEYEYYGRLQKYKTPDEAFIVYNTAQEAKLKQDHLEKVELFKKKQLLLAQQKLDEEQRRQLEQIRRENERRMEEEEKRRKEEEERQRAERDKEFRAKLYKQIRNETAGYVEEYGNDFAEVREYALSKAREYWLEIPNLIDQDMEKLLQPVREKIQEFVLGLKTGQERKEQGMAELLNQFKIAFNTSPNELKAPEGQEEFKTNAAAAYERHEADWEIMSLFRWAKVDDVSYLWNPLQKELEKFLLRAREWEGDTRTEKVTRALGKKFRDLVREDYLPQLRYGKAKASFDKISGKRYKQYEQSWAEEASHKTVAELWEPLRLQLESDFEKAQGYDRRLRQEAKRLKEEKEREQSPRRRYEGKERDSWRERDREERDDREKGRKRMESPRRKYKEERRDSRWEREKEGWGESKTIESPVRDNKRIREEKREETDKYRRIVGTGSKNYKESETKGEYFSPTTPTQTENNTPPVFSFQPFPGFGYPPQNPYGPGKDEWKF